MVLSSYTQSRGNKLKRISIPEITEPERIKVLWVQSMAFEKGKRVVSTKRHHHSFFELHFTLSGQITYECEKGNFCTVSEGELIMFSPGVLHAVNEYSEQIVRLSVTFLPQEDGFLFRELSAKGYHKAEMTASILDSFNVIFQETDHKDGFSNVLIKNRIFDVICSIARIAGITEPGDDIAEPVGDIRIDMIKQYINDNKNILLTCKDVAEQCHFNVKYINRVFKNKTGETLLEYIHKIKIRDAEQLLDNEKLSLEKISRRLGFANEYYFNSFFKRYTGIAPGQYRKLKNK